MPSAYRPGFQCSDSSFCNENAICTQYPNSPPTCSCKPGFSGSGIGSGGCLASSDPCLALNCKNGGVCVRNGTTSMYCQCPRGTSPPLCDRIDFCASNPCQNGGICTNNIRRFGPRRFSCACPKSFNGPNCENQVRKCGGLLTDWNGTLSYPPDQKSNYIHNARCAWLIKTNHTKVLSVTFKKFDLEVGNDCKFDWLQVNDIWSFFDILKNF